MTKQGRWPAMQFDPATSQNVRELVYRQSVSSPTESSFRYDLAKDEQNSHSW